MADVNHVILIGRLTRDAELKYTSGGFPVSNFSIAINRRRKNGDQWLDEVHYFDITLFGKAGESLKPYLLKGKQIAVDGELRQDRWEKDGQSRSKVYIAANNVQLLGGNNGQSGNAGGYNSEANSGGYSQNNNAPNNSYQQHSEQNNFKGQQSYAPQKNNYNAEAQYGGNDATFTEDIPF
ncbi:MAG: single-stranded DNA-binding protein [Treponema sp. CETP13]|nr:MAG: single-stranded DNA-binding protein [Treponema sp. CETP13]